MKIFKKVWEWTNKKIYMDECIIQNSFEGEDMVEQGEGGLLSFSLRIELDQNREKRVMASLELKKNKTEWQG